MVRVGTTYDSRKHRHRMLFCRHVESHVIVLSLRKVSANDAGGQSKVSTPETEFEGILADTLRLPSNTSPSARMSLRMLVLHPFHRECSAFGVTSTVACCWSRMLQPVLRG